MKQLPQGSGLRDIAIQPPTRRACYICSRKIQDVGLMCERHTAMIAGKTRDQAIELMKRMLD